MNKISKMALATAIFVGAGVILTQSASAFGGRGMGGGMKGEGGNGLIPVEMREEFHQQFQNMSEEEQAQLREERELRKGEHQAEMEEFSGISREEMREAHRNGESVAELLEENGVTEDGAREFLTQRATEKVEMISERHDLSEDQVQNLFSRIAEYVQNKLDRWFN